MADFIPNTALSVASEHPAELAQLDRLLSRGD
jgi:hypothetical protein